MEKCDCHLKHVKALSDIEKDIDKNRDDHKEIWIDIKSKVPNKLFYLFIVIFVGSLGLNMAIYDTVKSVDKKVAVIETRIDSITK